MAWFKKEVKMKTNKSDKSERVKLRPTINNRYIFKRKNLSYHTKCILAKMVNDLICGDYPFDFIYIEQNISGTWPEEIVWQAINELADAEIMYIDFDEEDFDEEDLEEEQEYEGQELLFNPEFMSKVCPSLDYCPCCNPAPVNFNINYN